MPFRGSLIVPAMDGKEANGLEIKTDSYMLNIRSLTLNANLAVVKTPYTFGATFPLILLEKGAGGSEVVLEEQMS